MSGEKTEQPTPKRLRQAREKGQVVKSQEVGSTFVVLTVFAYVWGGWGFIKNTIQEMILKVFSTISMPFDDAFPVVIKTVFTNFCYICMPLLFAVIVAAVVGNMIQVGVLFAFDSIKPDVNKLNPKNWFKKVFAMKNVLEFLKSVIKITVILVVIYNIFKGAISEILLIPYWGTNGIETVLGAIMLDIIKYCGGVFVAIAAVDYILQYKLFMKDQMMSKDDVKNEYKEMEGDPTIKSKRKQLHQEMVMNDQMDNVRKSDVLVTNPTHVAVAIQYKKGKTPLPIINAMGQGAIAQRMIKVAEEENIPIMRNVPLAHDLWEEGSVMEYIPSDLIEPVAEVLRWLQDLKDEGRL
jgi:type III secretion protein U